GGSISGSREHVPFAGAGCRPRSSVRSGAESLIGRPAFPRCRPQRTHHPLVVFDAERGCVATYLAARHMPAPQTRAQRSTVGGIVEDHAPTLSGRLTIVTWRLRRFDARVDDCVPVATRAEGRGCHERAFDCDSGEDGPEREPRNV